MSVKPCPSCQGPLANSADSCPRCGHKVKRTGCVWFAAILLVPGLLAFVLSTPSNRGKAPRQVIEPVTPKSKPISEAEKNKVRAACKEMIKRCLDNDVFTKVVGEESANPQVFTGGGWHLTTIDQKNSLLEAVGVLSVASVPLGDRPNSLGFYSVRVFDGGTGKKIGRWSSYDGYKEE